MRKKSILFVMMMAAAVVQSCRKSENAPGQTNTSTQSNTSGKFNLTSAGDAVNLELIGSYGGAAQVTGNSTAVGGTSNVGAYIGSVFQRWRIKQVTDTYFTIMNIGSGLYMQSYNYNGTEVFIQNTANTSDAQLWALSFSSPGVIKAVNKADGLALTTGSSGIIGLATYNASPSQGWKYNVVAQSGPVPVDLPSGTYTIASALTQNSMAMAIQFAGLTAGTQVVQYNTAAINEQKWKITRYDGGYYKITNVFSNLALDISATTAGSKVQMSKPAISDSQLWKIIYATQGAFGIVNKATGYCLALQNASTASGAFITQEATTQIPSHGWFFKPTNGMELDTVTTFSNSMQKNINAAVVLPSNYKSDGKRYPVIYLLHGHGGNYNDYPVMAPEIRDLADQFGVIIVCEDGNVTSWYLNATVNNPQQWQYETYTSTELVNYIDSHYRTIANRKGRGIVGLSMGGHGALYNAIKHQDVFSACGSMSGCVDITRLDTIGLKTEYNINDHIGPYSGANIAVWQSNSVLYMVDQLKPGSLAINFDCDDTDGFEPMNNDLHNKLTAMGIEHTFTHNHVQSYYGHSYYYWNYRLPYQFDFITSHLDKAQ